MENNNDNNCANINNVNNSNSLINVNNNLDKVPNRTSHHRFFERLYGHLEQSDKTPLDDSFNKNSSVVSDKTDEASVSSGCSSSPGLKSDFSGARCDFIPNQVLL